MGDKLFHADGQTDTTKPTVALCNAANEPTSIIIIIIIIIIQLPEFLTGI